MKVLLVLLFLPISALAGPIYQYNFVGQPSIQVGHSSSGYIQIPAEAVVPGANLYSSITKARFFWLTVIQPPFQEPATVQIRLSTEAGESKITYLDIAEKSTKRWTQGSLAVDDELFPPGKLVIDESGQIVDLMLCLTPYPDCASTGGVFTFPDGPDQWVAPGALGLLQSGAGSWTGPVKVPEPPSWIVLLVCIAITTSVRLRTR